MDIILGRNPLQGLVFFPKLGEMQKETMERETSRVKSRDVVTSQTGQDGRGGVIEKEES